MINSYNERVQINYVGEVTMKKSLIIVGIIILSLLIIGFGFEKETKPREDTRLILEHTYKTYIAPPCFEDSNATNYLEDSDIAMANQLGYEPNDACTEEALKPVKEKIIISFLHEFGILKTEWSTW